MMASLRQRLHRIILIALVALLSFLFLQTVVFKDQVTDQPHQERKSFSCDCSRNISLTNESDIVVVPTAVNNSQQYTKTASRYESHKAAYHSNKAHYTRYCKSMIEGDFTVYGKAKAMAENHSEFQIPNDSKFVSQLNNCTLFKEDNGYPHEAFSKSTADFPIAFSIILHKDFAQAERLIRAIYQPQNVYCLHVDAKSASVVKNAASAFCDCFSNVFLASKQEKVVYASFSRLKADLNCMEDLLKRKNKWRYVINLTGQVFPLKTNEEIVQILKIYNGANDIEGLNGVYLHSVNERFKFKWKIGGGRIRKTKEEKEPPPHGIRLVKGSAFGVFNRAFIEFIFEDKIAVDFLEWTKDTYSPDELFWATLNVRFLNPMLKAPGGFINGVPDRKPWLAMYSTWRVDKLCSGKYIRDICILTLRDLPLLTSLPHLFANKFYSNDESMVLDCLESWLHNKTQSSIPGNFYYYKNLPFVYH